MRKLAAYLDDQLVGTLSEADDLWRFDYDPQWAADPGSFDVSPALPRTTLAHIDGSTTRTVQWYFDNLLPEEAMREVVAKESGLQTHDSFALLEYLGAESAGSLVLLPVTAAGGIPLPATQGDLRLLADEELSARIRNLPRQSLSSGAPKRMSVAGAQNKLLVVYRDGQLFEPVGAQPSTHLLKPNHTSEDYPASVINEYVTMRLAHRLSLPVPAVHRRYVPEPVYLVDRFDRYVDETGRTRRLHVVDACQLLNKPRAFKYNAATLETLVEVVQCCRNKPRTRLKLFDWLVFNALIGNHDNHLKNLSFMVSDEGIELAQFYDLLSTASYHTRAFADGRADWPRVGLAIELAGAKTFADITKESLLSAGAALGIARRACERRVAELTSSLAPALEAEVAEIDAQNVTLPENTKVFQGGESRFLRVMTHGVVHDMLARVQG